MEQIIEISHEEFEKRFKPIANPSEPSTNLFETYGEDLEFLKKQNTANLWTLLCEGEDMTIVSGICWVNRMNYLVTENPWTIPIQVDY